MSLAKLEDNHQSHFWGTNLNIDLDKVSFAEKNKK